MRDGCLTVQWDSRLAYVADWLAAYSKRLEALHLHQSAETCRNSKQSGQLGGGIRR